MAGGGRWEDSLLHIICLFSWVAINFTFSNRLKRLIGSIISFRENTYEMTEVLNAMAFR